MPDFRAFSPLQKGFDNAHVSHMAGLIIMGHPDKNVHALEGNVTKMLLFYQVQAAIAPTFSFTVRDETPMMLVNSYRLANTSGKDATRVLITELTDTNASWQYWLNLDPEHQKLLTQVYAYDAKPNEYYLEPPYARMGGCELIWDMMRYTHKERCERYYLEWGQDEEKMLCERMNDQEAFEQFLFEMRDSFSIKAPWCVPTYARMVQHPCPDQFTPTVQN